MKIPKGATHHVEKYDDTYNCKYYKIVNGVYYTFCTKNNCWIKSANPQDWHERNVTELPNKFKGNS